MFLKRNNAHKILLRRKKMNSFIGWVGGKNHLKKQIISLIPDDAERYIEVFGGAGWVLFGKEQHPNFLHRNARPQFRL